MPIPLTTPVNIPAQPAQPEKTYPDAWIRELIVFSPSHTEGEARFVIQPYNGQTGEILDGAAPEVLSAPLWRACAEVPEVAAAMAAVLACVEPLRDWLAQQTT